MMANEETTLTRREAARYVGVHYNTIRLWERQGRITPERVMAGGVEEVRIPIDQLTEIMTSRGEQPEASLLLRPESIQRSPEAMTLWRLYEEVMGDNRRLSEDLATERMRCAQLETRLEKCEKESGKLLQAVLSIAHGKGGEA